MIIGQIRWEGVSKKKFDFFNFGVGFSDVE